MSEPNRLARVIAKFASMPPWLRRFAMTSAFTSQVRFAGTGAVQILELAEGRALLQMKNLRKVQNHIGTIHATGMALLAESATGVALGMTLPDSKIPLLKSMHIDYVRRAKGTLRAEATLPADMRQRVLTEDKGDFAVPVKVTDEAGEEPIKCQMVWAWVPKKKPS
jgi:acyl-coenzyme A thioesterase PaaI-like protein